MAAIPRPGTAADAILGAVPRVVYSPASLQEAQEILRLCARERMSVGFAGGRTEIGLGARPLRLDALVETRLLARVFDYAPSDMVLAAEAGTPVAAIQALAGKEGQQLALDPPLSDRATVGGVIAANSFGPRRARYGSARDVIIGVSLIRGDGALAHGGGKVVKNVAGFDLPKMACGSLGTLAMIGTVTFRLHPLPEESATLLLERRKPAQIRGLLEAMVKAQLEPTSVVALRDEAGGDFALAVRFEGFAAGVKQQTQALQRISRESGGAAEDRLADAEARAVWARHDAVRTQGNVRLKLTAQASQLERLERAALEPLEAALRSPRVAWYASLGIGFISGDAADTAAAATAIDSARKAAVACGGSLTMTAAPEELRARVDVWGPPPPAFALMRRLKERFDPEHRLSPGRFVGGI
jgi:glycolate oxidase FAD binding subunit